VYERRGRFNAGRDIRFLGIPAAGEWLRSKGHGFKTQVNAASGAVALMNMQENAKKAYAATGDQNAAIAYLAQQQDAMMQNLWKINVVDIENTIETVVDKVRGLMDARLDGWIALCSAKRGRRLIAARATLTCDLIAAAPNSARVSFVSGRCCPEWRPGVWRRGSRAVQRSRVMPGHTARGDRGTSASPGTDSERSAGVAGVSRARHRLEGPVSARARHQEPGRHLPGRQGQVPARHVPALLREPAPGRCRAR
jgi:X-domain of DnaJ-containing